MDVSVAWLVKFLASFSADDAFSSPLLDPRVLNSEIVAGRNFFSARKRNSLWSKVASFLCLIMQHPRWVHHLRMTFSSSLLRM